jgi:hypothetical protein
MSSINSSVATIETSSAPSTIPTISYPPTPAPSPVSPSSINSCAATFGTSPTSSAQPTHAYPPSATPALVSPPPSPTFSNVSTLELTLFNQQEHPFSRHGAEVLHLKAHDTLVLSTDQVIRLRDGKLYKLKELQKISKKWVVFRCDQCNKKGKLVKRGDSYLFAVEPRFVKRTFWGRLGRTWFEARQNFLCIR